MPVRPRLQAVRERRIHYVCFLIGDGGPGSGFTGHETFPDRETARRAWPEYRREVWAHTRVGDVPAAAELYDDLTTNAETLVKMRWQSKSFPLQQVLQAIADDRAAVERFIQRDPKGARTISDFLSAFLDSFQVVEEEARRLASSERGYPHRIGMGTRYGDLVGVTTH